MENTGLVSWDLDVADQGRVAPDAEGVVGEAGRGDDLLVVRRPAERSDLGSGVDAVDTSTRGSVPEVDVTVVGSSSSSKEVGLPRAPGQRLDGSLVVGLAELRNSQGSRIPDANKVVVSTRRELGAVSAPLETADLGSVRHKLGDLVLSDADIMVEDQAGSRTGREGVLVPAHDTNTGLMTVHASNLDTLLNIPDLDFARAQANANVRSVAGPLHAANVGVGGSLKKAADGAGLGRPDVDVAFQADGDLVAGRPVEEVEVVVVDKAGSVEDALRGGGDTASELGRGSGGLERAVVLGAEVDRS